MATFSPDVQPRRPVIAGVAAIVVAAVTLGTFVLCCWSAAADAQGAIAFVVLAPVLWGGAVFSPLIARRSAGWRHQQWASVAAGAAALVVTLFYVSAVVPPLRIVSNGMISAVSGGYERLTGESPYAADQRRSRERAARGE